MHGPARTVDDGAMSAPQQQQFGSGSTVKLANVTALYSDKVTDSDNEH